MAKQWRYGFAAVLLLCMMLPLCAGAETNQTVSIDGHSFSFRLPEGWTLDELDESEWAAGGFAFLYGESDDDALLFYLEIYDNIKDPYTMDEIYDEFSGDPDTYRNVARATVSGREWILFEYVDDDFMGAFTSILEDTLQISMEFSPSDNATIVEMAPQVIASLEEK